MGLYNNGVKQTIKRCLPVKHVMDCGSGKGSPECLPVPHLGHTDDGVGNGGADVGAEDHWHGMLHLNSS